MPADMIDDDTTFARKQDLGLPKHKPLSKMASYRFKLLPVSVVYNFLQLIIVLFERDGYKSAL